MYRDPSPDTSPELNELGGNAQKEKDHVYEGMVRFTIGAASTNVARSYVRRDLLARFAAGGLFRSASVHSQTAIGTLVVIVEFFSHKVARLFVSRYQSGTQINFEDERVSTLLVCSRSMLNELRHTGMKSTCLLSVCLTMSRCSAGSGLHRFHPRPTLLDTPEFKMDLTFGRR